jgi:hypothetical protein
MLSGAGINKAYHVGGISLRNWNTTLRKASHPRGNTSRVFDDG